MKNRARAAPATEPAGAPSVAQFSDVARKDERQHSEPAIAAGRGRVDGAGKDRGQFRAFRPGRSTSTRRIVRIRKLHDEGKLADAAKELLALRQAIPDADGRLPPELRAWAATVKP